MYFIMPVLEKAQRKNTRLVPKLITVTRDGKTYQTTVWVLPMQAKNEQPGGDVQFDLFAEADHNWREKVLENVGNGTRVQYKDKRGVERSGEVKYFMRGEYKILSGQTMSTVAPEQITMILPETKPEKIADIINSVTTDTRQAAQAALFGADMTETAPEKYEFKPTYFKDNDFAYMDYRDVVPLKIGLIPSKSVMEMKRPEWMPSLSDESFAYANYRIEALKVKENDYIVLGRIGDSYRVNADLLAVMQDYYMKRAKVRAQKAYDDLVARNPGRRVRKPSVRMLSENKATHTVLNASSERLKSGADRWAPVKNAIADMKQKLADLNIQMEEDISTHGKGRATAYGDKGTRKDLFDEYGVLVKRQNGDPISVPEVNQIKEALDSLYEIYGNRSSMARKFGLKISHSGNVLQHARNASGIYFPYYHAIGVTAKYGDKGFGFTLAHEWAHFMDNYLGSIGDRHTYASDDWASLPGSIARAFRENMERPQKSDYQNRTCECFARALEQYFATKTETVEEYQKEWNGAGNHPRQAVFTEKVQPLIERFFKENDEMLKAVQW